MPFDAKAGAGLLQPDRGIDGRPSHGPAADLLRCGSELDPPAAAAAAASSSWRSSSWAADLSEEAVPFALQSLVALPPVPSPMWKT